MLRWRKNPRPKGLARVCSGHPGFTLYKDKTLRCATVNVSGDGGWYWVAGWESGIPSKNTCDSPVEHEYMAKEQALAYVKQHIKNACN